MVEFIVLGIVPGTQLEISFAHVATLAWFGFMAYCLLSSKQSTNPQGN